ncbi:uncharacterized protein LOC124156996 [Ischnura elegans]|uniref:uncharacterized protein LOC124156996 n=1 Tax=Ischnura elegans TaxID=197161 RepID=UPI001ED88110|nr:uncharacterized protein LOC124156996 [Ischnura elegans]
MATPLTLLEFDEVGQLFHTVIHHPVPECDSLLQGIASADIRDGCGQTLLHVAVRHGSSEWVRKLLSICSDPCAMDHMGSTVLAVAEEMRAKHPEESERQDILAIVRLVWKRDLLLGRARTEGSAALKHGESEQQNGLIMQQTSKSTLEKIAVLNELIKDQQQCITTQANFMSMSLQQETQAVNAHVTPPLASNFPSPGCEHQSGPDSVTLENENRGDLTNVVSSQDAEDISKSGRDVSQNLVADMGTDEVLNPSSVLSIVTSGGQSPPDPPSTKADKCTQVQGDLFDGIVSRKEISELKATIDKMRAMFASRDILLRALEGSVTSMADEFGSVRSQLENIGEKVGEMGKDLGRLGDSSSCHVQSSSSLMESRRREACVEAMMRKTDILNGDEGKVYEIRGYYAHLCSNNLLAPLFSFLATQANVRVMIDCRSQYVGGLRDTFVDHDGMEREGGWFYSFADFKRRRVYLGGKTSESRKREAVMGWLARSLAQMAMCLAFNNEGRPYAAEDVEKRDRYRLIVQRAEKIDLTLDTYLRWSLDWDALVMREVKLISAVPLMIAEYGSVEARIRLQQQLPGLLDFYKEHVLATLESEVEAALSITCSTGN